MTPPYQAFAETGHCEYSLMPYSYVIDAPYEHLLSIFSKKGARK